MAKPIMIQGTMSNVGKSIVAGGLCRVFHQDGYQTAPFKSQNMALNSFITKAGLEMGRAQVMQAEAAGIEPEVAMNPILLKPSSDTGSQVILNGEPVGMMPAVEYYRRKREYVPAVLSAYQSLFAKYDIIVIEGAGSPAEINLKKDDIVNMGLAEMVDAPVLLVGDIDRGGVFAQIVGTLELLEPRERARVKGILINKFRGSKAILKPGLDMLEERIGIPVLGVIPYAQLDIDEEDSLTQRFAKKERAGLVDIVVIRLPRISNFTDFAPLECMAEVSLRYVGTPAEFGDPDAVILPGTKNTIADLRWLRENGLEAKILRHSAGGGLVFGICGGYQMLGERIEDPLGAEGGGSIRGLSLLPVVTTFRQEKKRTRTAFRFKEAAGILKGLSGIEAEGYEIHMGVSAVKGRGLLTLYEASGAETRSDGAGSKNVYGCYVHGIFDKAEVSGGFVRALMAEKGYADDGIRGVDMAAYKEAQYNRLAKLIRGSIDMAAVYKIMEGSEKQ